VYTSKPDNTLLGYAARYSRPDGPERINDSWVECYKAYYKKKKPQLRSSKRLREKCENGGASTETDGF